MVSHYFKYFYLLGNDQSSESFMISVKLSLSEMVMLSYGKILSLPHSPLPCSFIETRWILLGFLHNIFLCWNQNQSHGTLSTPLELKSSVFIYLGKGAEKKCSKSMVFYQPSPGPPPPGLVFFCGKKLTPIFLLENASVAETNFTFGPMFKTNLFPF